MNLKRTIVIGIAVLFSLVLVACGNKDTEPDTSTSKSVGELVDYNIVGTDPGSGLMQATNQALEEYELTEWTLNPSSPTAMTAELQRAYENEEPIIVTGWSPHWKFTRFDLKYLDDPKEIYGGDTEKIHTLARMGLKEDMPEAYTILERFEWEEEDMASIMIDIEDGVEPEEAAQKWVDNNKDKVSEWTDGVDKVNNDKITLVYAAWDTEIASHNMMKIVLEDMGYDVEMSIVEAGPMFTAVADGSADVTLAAWLPITHEPYYEEYGDNLDDLGINMENVKQGLVVPTYMDIDSIEDLKE